MLRQFRTYPGITVAAGEQKTINVTGSYLSCYAASDDFRIAFDDGVQSDFFGGAEVLLPGHQEKDRPETFTKVTIINPNAGTLTVSLAVSFGEFRDRRLTAIGSIATLAKKSPADTLDLDATTVAAAATQILTGHADNAAVIVTNIGANTVYIGSDNTVTTGDGHPLAAGATLTLEDYTGDLYGIVAAGTEAVRATAVRYA